MRVLDCDECGDTVQAVDDEALVRELREHYDREAHGELDEADARDLVEREAYDASDA